MSNVIYDYPKSSCNCYDCKNKTYVSSTGTPSNLSVTSCNVERLYDCYDHRPFRIDLEPEPDNNGYKLLNPQVYLNNYAKDWQMYPCNNIKGCKNSFVSPDPTLIDSARGLVMTLDRPPIDDDVKMKDVYKEKYTRYGKDYDTYTDIDGGQIMYYISNSIKDPFFSPNFVSTATMEADVYKDPMSAMKPQYNRFPIKNNDPIRSEKDNYEYGLSWMNDSLGHRQDIMALQMRKMNEQRWSNRWE